VATLVLSQRWKVSEDRKRLTLTDGFDAGSFKLVGSRDLHFYQPKQIKRIRIIKRADGYYSQFLIDAERNETPVYTGSQLGIDVGLSSFYTDSNGQKNPLVMLVGYCSASGLNTPLLSLSEDNK
jgi:putative transposase